MNLEENSLLGGRYRLIRQVGNGTFGEVWLARDEQVGMEVAIKIYIALDKKGIKEFKEEYSGAYRLNHQNLLHATGFDIDGDRPFLVMPYCPDSAVELVGKTDETEIWKFIRDVASGLEYLHTKDIVHRDIKPDNILRDQDGNYLITDFGVSLKMKSTLRRNSVNSNAAGNFAGTLPYMGPEMFSDNPSAVKATDIWALGVTLYEIITGELPFFGQGGVMLTSGAKVPKLPEPWSPNLRALVCSCLDAQTWNRPTATQLRKFADSVLEGQNPTWPSTIQTSEQPETPAQPQAPEQPQTSPRATAPQNPTQPTTGSRTKTIVISSIIAAAILIVVGLVFIFGRQSEAESQELAFSDEIITVNGVSFKMIAVHGGTFQMGATSEQVSDAYSDEQPVHSVTLSSFRISETEVTQELWQAVMGSNPSYYTSNGLQCPVECVSWDDCQSFILELNRLTGKNFRLPTEAEWEFAARGGNKSRGYKYSGSDNLGSVAWYSDNSGDRTHAVKTKSPNELGIYDMSGNVWEWCSDWYGTYPSGSVTDPKGPSGGEYRVNRGGSCYSFAVYCRVSDRSRYSQSGRNDDLGLRLAI